MKDKWKNFNGKAFTFQEFRDSIVNECLFGEDPDKVATASLEIFIHEGHVQETKVGQETWYIRTGKKLPPPR